MESLWHLEDKWKLSTNGAVLLLVCATSLLIGVCAATVLKRKSAANKKDQLADVVKPKWSSETGCIGSWGVSVKRVLMGTVRWSGASKWEEGKSASWQEGLLGRAKVEERDDGPVVSHNSESPVWQRPILMGEKCEMPRFSGLILYDERGQPLHNKPSFVAEIKQEKPIAANVRTTLRDLL